MSDTLKYGIPRTLDDAAKFLWWDIDQALLVFTFIVLGMLVDSMMGGIITGILMGWSYGKMKSGKHKAFAIHAMYWYLPSEFMSFKRTPPSHHREFIG